MVTSDDLKIFPDKPGVYLMKDGRGKIIYIGKAVSLKNRVRSYFQPARNLSARIQAMVKQVDRVEYITTNNEVEALALECNLIKEEHPKYNIRLRDDKQYPWVKITVRESFPRVYITRRLKRDGSKYYGPYTDVAALRDALKLLKEVFPLRSCRHDLDREKVARPCLNFHIRRCLAPCGGLVSKETYREIIKEVMLFLEGRQGELAEKLTTEMNLAAGRREYEKAAVYRDRLRDIRKIMEKQTVVTIDRDEADVFGMARDELGTLIQVFQVRDGKLVGREYFQVREGIETDPAGILKEFLTQYYDESGFVPKEIIIPYQPPEPELIKEWLNRLRGGRVYLKLPQKGEKLRLIRMAAENAANLLQQERSREKRREDLARAGLAELQRELGLPLFPARIEGFDISNIQGTDAVASMVVFEDGRPRGAEYRRFKIKTVVGPNDFAMLREAIRRRFSKGLAQRQDPAATEGKFAAFPDLLLIDGGKGQLAAVREALEELGLSRIPTLSLAKQAEEIYLPDRDAAIILSRRSEALKLLQRVRDEAHRFAITYHKTLRDKRTVSSGLDAIKGIGPKKKQALLKYFGSVKRISEAAAEELLKVPGVTPQLAERIKEEL